MTDLDRVRSAWTGFSGAPGVTTMYFLDTVTAVASVHDFWNSVATYLPNDVHILVENAGDVIDDETGDLVGAWSADAVTPAVGVDDNPYPAPSGACITWLTETILDGRRLRGRTFIVPLAGSKYQNDGTLAEGTITALNTIAADLIAAQSASFVIYHRKSGTHAGGNGLVTSAVVHDMAAVLRSRRD